MFRDVILTAALFLFYFMSMRLISSFLDRFHRLYGFKRLVASAPLSIIAGIMVILISPLSLQEAGFSLGDPIIGLKTVLIGGLPVAIVTAISVLLASRESIRKIRYGSAVGIRYQMIYSWLLVGIVEEILFRGFLQSSLDTFLTGSFVFIDYSVIFSSSVFVLMHAANALTGLESLKQFFGQIPMRFLVSLLLGITFQISGSLLYSIIIHNLIDGLNMTALIYRKRRFRRGN